MNIVASPLAASETAQRPDRVWAMRISLFPDLELEGWKSMNLYAEQLARHLRRVNCRDEIVLVRMRPPEWIGGFGSKRRWEVFRFYWRYWVYPRKATRWSADVNHILDHSYAHVMSKLNPQRTVITVHDLYPLHLIRSRPRTLRERMRRDVLLWVMDHLRGASRLIADSQFVKREIVELLGYPERQIAVVPLGGDHIIVRGSDEGTAFRRRYAIDDRARVILHVGGCDERKNVRVLLLALNEVRQGPGDVILVHIGDAFGSEDWRVVEEFQLQPSLRLIVNAAAEDLAAAYAAADVVVIPSIYEGFGLPAVEAMAAGTPVVGLRAAALSEVIGEAGLLVDENTPAAFADALSKVLNDPEQRQILSRRGKERAACFTWERTARLTDEVYHRIIEGM